MKNQIVIKNAKENNLKGIDVNIPRDSLTVITGVSGSGKSSLAFETIFVEGQRRYMASMSSYARQFLGKMERPNVDLIEGLSPTISIDQKTAGRNPRSTVGTVTEIYDYLRLLYARLGKAYCPKGHGEIEHHSTDTLVQILSKQFLGKTLIFMAPIVLDRKGEYRKELKQYQEQGYIRVRIDGEIKKLEEDIELARYEKHRIEIVLDRLKLKIENKNRVAENVNRAMEIADGKLSILISSEDKSTKNKKEFYQLFSNNNTCNQCGFSFPELEPRIFSFNNPQGWCIKCIGLGEIKFFEGKHFYKDSTKAIFNGGLAVINDEGNVLFAGTGHWEIKKIYKYWNIGINTPVGKLPNRFINRLFNGVDKEKDGVDFDLVSALDSVYRKYNITIMERYMTTLPCSSCQGHKLTPAALNVLVNDKNIAELGDLSITELLEFIQSYSPASNKVLLAEPIIREILERLYFLFNVGLDYLSLSRKANTLSGGESQRIRLASQVGSGLEGCTYVMDEPSIGLHQSDNEKLIKTLKNLRNKNNTVLVIEHDEDTMLNADFLIDIGNDAGIHGGNITFQDLPSNLFSYQHQSKSSSHTFSYLSGQKIIKKENYRSLKSVEKIILNGINKNNLVNIDLELPLSVLNVVVGVSGSGKSTLILNVLNNAVRDYLQPKSKKTLWHQKTLIPSELDKLIEIDQKPIGRTPRSNIVTYTRAMDHIRDLFALLPISKMRGYKKGRFSFNVKGGRCEVCQGAGVIQIENQLFSTVEVECEICNGKRFNESTLEVRFKGLNIFQILELSVNQACDFFKNLPKIFNILKVLKEIGLGYIKLGQSSTSLSGGEAQRIKLASELSRSTTGKTLYILDEPTTGLHFHDIGNLMKGIEALVDKGNTVVIIEHNMEVIRLADSIIELGPGGGKHGGQIVFQGTTQELRLAKTATGREYKTYYQKYLEREKKQLINNAEKFSKMFNSTKLKDFHEDFQSKISIRGLAKNNLKNISLDIPKGKMIVFTGVSGSGKTTLAFQTIFQEGQRKYIESLSTYARRFLGRIPRVQADKISGISPTIAVDQKAGNKNPRSTLATYTELYDSFRILFANIGQCYCPRCYQKLEKDNSVSIVKKMEKENKLGLLLAPLFDIKLEHEFVIKTPIKLKEYTPYLLEQGYQRLWIDGIVIKIEELKESTIKNAEKIYLVIDKLNPAKQIGKSRLTEGVEQCLDIGEGVLIFCVQNDNKKTKTIGYTIHRLCFNDGFSDNSEIIPRSFSFNHHSGACQTCQGLGKVRTFIEDLFIIDTNKPFLVGALNPEIAPFITRRGQIYGRRIKSLSRRIGIDIWKTPWRLLESDHRKFILYGKKAFRRPIPDGDIYDSTWPGIAYVIMDLYARSESDKWRSRFAKMMDFGLCPDCEGGRLKASLLAVHLLAANHRDSLNIHQLNQKSVREALSWFKNLKNQLSKRDFKMIKDVYQEILFRLEHLDNLGLHYLELARPMSTLSGGENQRVRLSTQIGNKLKDVIYVLDEPTIGLHEKDTAALIKSLRELNKRGNTVILVEHDGDVIKASDWVVDLGPGAGESGGNIQVNEKNKKTGLKRASYYNHIYKKNEQKIRKIIDIGKNWKLKAKNISKNNVKSAAVDIPLSCLVGISGVSGAGKSSLSTVLARRLAIQKDIDICFANGKAILKKEWPTVHLVDQSPVTSSTRSNIASYIEIFDLIRNLFAMSKKAKILGLTKGHFSFNSHKGQCESCSGKGVQEIEMHFISDISLVCEVCKGRQYKDLILQTRIKQLNIADVLNLTVEQAINYFIAHLRIKNRLQLLKDSGLGYLKLGLSTNTLSGGELQRLKLVKELSKTALGPQVFFLDEPTTGLHFKDIDMLIYIIDHLIQKGHSFICIEHNKLFLSYCDYLIDMGPDAGLEGGKVLIQGTPEKLKQEKIGYTWKYLS